MKLSQLLFITVGIVKFGAFFASDLLLETIGYIDKQVVHQNCLLVTSNHNAACIHKAHGELNWKFSLPSQSVEHHIAYSNEEAFFLSKTVVNDKQFYVVQAVLLSTGFFSWDFSLPYLRSGNQMLEYYYDNRINAIKFVFENSIIVLELGTERKFFQWTSSDATSTKNIRLNTVINTNLKENGVIAMGCNVSPGNNCESLFMINFDYISKKFSVNPQINNAFNNKFPTAVSSATFGTILYDAEVTIGRNKEKHSLDISLLELGIKEKIHGKVQINIPTADGIIVQLETFVSKDSLGELKPLIVVSGTTASKDINHVVVVEITHVNNVWAFTEVYSNYSPQKFVVSKQLISSKTLIVTNWKVCHISESESNFSVATSAAKVIAVHLPAALYSIFQPQVLLDLNPNSLFILLNSGILINAVHLPLSNEWKLNWARNEGLGNLHDVYVVNPEEPENLEKVKSPYSLSNILSADTGLNKHQVVVGLSYEEGSRLHFSKAKLQVHLIDMSAASCGITIVHPIIDANEISNPIIRSIRSIPIFNFEEFHHNANHVIVVVDTENAGVMMWKIDIRSTLLKSSLSAPAESCSIHQPNLPSVVAIKSYFSLNGLGSLLSLYPSSSNLVKLGGDITMLLQENSKTANVVTTNVASVHSPQQLVDSYFNSVNITSGMIKIFKATSQPCEIQTKGDYMCKTATEIANIMFDPKAEKIVDISYPTFIDKVHSRAATLGDSNVLLKYLNPNIVVISTLSVDDTEQSMTKDARLAINIFDTVSGKLLQRITHDSASLPVASVAVENFIVVSYWNSKAKRTELSSIGLYDGFIGKYDFKAFKSENSVNEKRSPLGSIRSGYSTAVPLVMQKTFILPGKIINIAHTVSAKGINNKNLLITFSSGQIYSLDFRMFHPRRPLSDPTPAEKEEGLIKYFPYVFLPPTAAITANVSITSSGEVHVVSSAARLESKSLVVGFGLGSNLFIKTITPSQGFDTLAEDFKYELLIALVGGLAVLVYVLHIISAKVTLQRLWH